MVLKYFVARLKKTILPTIGVSFALSVVIFLLVVATAMPSIMSTAVENHSRRISGNADLVLTNAHDTPDRFFGLTQLRQDPILAEHSEYIYGVFWTYAQLDTPNGRRSFGAVFAGDLQAQSLHNPLVPGIVPGVLPESGIIIGEEFARTQGLRGGERIYIVFGGRRIGFDVLGIARNEGLLASGNAVFISSAAMSRIIPLVGSGIVTHAFVRANSPESLDIITSHLEDNFSRLDVARGDQIGDVQNVINQFSIHIFLVAIIAVIFCLISLFILLRLAFARDRQNFARLSSLGLSKFKLGLISLLYGLLLCIFGIVFAVLALQVTLSIVASAPILTGYSFGMLPYVIGVGSGLLIGIACALLSIFAPQTIGNKSRYSAVFYAICCAILVAVGITGVLLVTIASNLALILICIAFFGFLFFLPKAIAPLMSGLHSKAKNIYSLRLKALSKSKTYNYFVSFGLIVTLVMIMAVSLPIEAERAIRPPKLPFDVAVVSITNPSTEVFENVAEASGVAVAVRAEIDIRANITFGGLESSSNLLGLDQYGLDLFGADFEATRLFDGRGAVVGERFATSRRLRVGDEFGYNRQGREHSFIVAQILQTDYFGGNVILVDLASLAVYGRPYSDILIVTEGDFDYAMQNVAMIEGLFGAVLDVDDLVNFVVAVFGEFSWLINWLSFSIIALALITVLLMVIIRRIAEDKDALALTPLGLTKAKHISQTLFSVFVVLLIAFVTIPIFVFLIERASLSFFNIFGIRNTISVRPITMILTTVVCFAFVIVVESIVVAVKKISA